MQPACGSKASLTAALELTVRHFSAAQAVGMYLTDELRDSFNCAPLSTGSCGTGISCFSFFSRKQSVGPQPAQANAMSANRLDRCLTSDWVHLVPVHSKTAPPFIPTEH